MKTLESLYYGIIHSPDYELSDERQYQTLLELVVRNEADLTDTLADAQKETFDKFKACVDELHSMNEVKAFADGFTLAADIMMEVATAE